jgi:hypothetical protein
MNTYKRNVFGLFFLSYFAVYAVSPIIYTLSAGKASEVIKGETKVSSFADGCQVFLLEAVLAKFILREADPSGSAAVKFLGMKKRAVLPEKGLEKTPYPEVSFREDAPLFLPAPLACRTGDSVTTTGGGEHRPLFLCHSPPASKPLPA